MAKSFPFLKQIRSFSLFGILHFLSLRMRGKTILVTGGCRGCGMCCRSISLEGKDGWLRSEKAFYDVATDYPEYRRFMISGKDEHGFLLFSCTWSTPHGNCLDYEKRLTLCRRFPESSLVFAGGILPATCGYKFTEVVPFQKVFKAAVQRLK